MISRPPAVIGMKKSRISRNLVLSMLVGSMVSSVSAVSITITNVTPDSGTPFDLTFSGGTLTSDVSVPAPYAGQILLQTNEAGQIGAWCVDLYHDLFVGSQYTYSTGVLTSDGSGTSNANSNQITPQQAQNILALATYGNQTLSTMPLGTGRSMFSGEVQAAIWSIVSGNATVTASGSTINGYTPQNFMDGTKALIAQAPTLSVGATAAIFDLDANGTILSQNLVATSLYLVPEPSTLSLVFLAFGGFLLRRRRAA